MDGNRGIADIKRGTDWLWMQGNREKEWDEKRTKRRMKGEITENKSR